MATCKYDFDTKLSWDVLMFLVEMLLSTLLYYAASPRVRSPQSIIRSMVSMLTSKEIKHWERGLKICNDNFYRTYSLHRLPQQKTMCYTTSYSQTVYITIRLCTLRETNDTCSTQHDQTLR